MPLLEQPQTLGGTASASLKMIALCFLLFSLLSIPKLTPASCHAECEFYLKSVMLVKLLISALSHGWESYGPDFSTRFPLAAVSHQWEYCCSAFPFSCVYFPTVLPLILYGQLILYSQLPQWPRVGAEGAFSSSLKRFLLTIRSLILDPWIMWNW